jgi:hypothetical protein
MKQPLSMYRDILDIADEIRRILGHNGKGIAAEELELKIEKDETPIMLELSEPSAGQHFVCREGEHRSRN